MPKIKILGEEIEYQRIVVSEFSVEIDEKIFTLDKNCEDTWNSIECDETDILVERQKAIDEAEKLKGIPNIVSSQDEEIALLWYEKMQDESRIESNETEIASLTYDLMMGGII